MVFKAYMSRYSIFMFFKSLTLCLVYNCKYGIIKNNRVQYTVLSIVIITSIDAISITISVLSYSALLGNFLIKMYDVSSLFIIPLCYRIIEVVLI